MQNSALTDYIIIATKKSIIKFEGTYWVRQNRQDGFNITMAPTDSSQVTDLVKIYILFCLYTAELPYTD